MARSLRILFFILASLAHYEASEMQKELDGSRWSLLNIEGKKQSPSRSVIEIVKTIERPPTNFTGEFHSEYFGVDIEGYKESMSPEKEQSHLSWEEASPESGERIEQLVRFRPRVTAGLFKLFQNQTNERYAKQAINVPYVNEGGSPRIIQNRAHIQRRRKRKIYGRVDSRRYVSWRLFGRRFPYASVVKLSTGCSGTLVSPKHVLTAAHCIHDQRDYVKGFKDLKVALLPSRGNRYSWIKVNTTFLPRGWTIGDPEIASRFDYCLLRLEETHEKPYFKLAVGRKGIKGKWIHFTAYEDDKPSNTLWYRACTVKEVDAHVLYHRCDAMPGSSGAGVYMWMYDRARRYWSRRLIGVFSGNRSYPYKEWWRRTNDFNAAIRITSSKYAQICTWMGKYARKSCKEKKANDT